MLRIIGGTAKGRTILIPKGCRIRPTSDRIKESLFNIIAPPEGQTILDLYAGSGNLGIEALSRGAAKAVFVESDHACAGAIRGNLEKTGLLGRSEIFQLEARRAFQLLKKGGYRFDLIFADPPYEENHIDSTLKGVLKFGLAKDTGIIIIQHSRKEKPERPEFEIFDQRRYGESLLTFMRLKTQR